MIRHLELVAGPLGETTALPCACGRYADHERPTARTGLRLEAVETPGRPHRHAQRVARLFAVRPPRGRHAA